MPPAISTARTAIVITSAARMRPFKPPRKLPGDREPASGCAAGQPAAFIAPPE